MAYTVRQLARLAGISPRTIRYYDEIGLLSCFIAVQDGKIIGFACYDVTAKGFFGPTGVTAEARGQGVGRALLLATLHGLAEMGYAYAIIGGAGPVDFYRKAVGAIEIEGSEPGIYRDWLPTGERT